MALGFVYIKYDHQDNPYGRFIFNVIYVFGDI